MSLAAAFFCYQITHAWHMQSTAVNIPDKMTFQDLAHPALQLRLMTAMKSYRSWNALLGIKISFIALQILAVVASPEYVIGAISHILFADYR